MSQLQTSLLVLCNNNEYWDTEKINFQRMPENSEVNYLIKTHGSIIISISITLQCEERKETIFKWALEVLRFYMLLHGYFEKIERIYFSKTQGELCTDVTDELKNGLLDSHTTPDFLSIYLCHLYSFNETNKHEFKEKFEKWLEIEKKLDLSYKVFLYAICKEGPLFDIRNVLLIQIYEPLYDFLKEEFKEKEKALLYEGMKTCRDNDKKSKKPKPCLKDKLRLIFEKYGSDIFDFEKTNGTYDDLLTFFVKSRNRIVHVKSEQEKKTYLSGEGCMAYNIKLYILYRKILLDKLNINKDKDKYEERLNLLINETNKLRGILHRDGKGS